jgi:MOB kinase activator 1
MYIKHIQTWVNGKIQDPKIFVNDQFTSAPQIPTAESAMMDPNYWRGKSSGFPQRFEHEIKNMYKQMFRCYAHLFWQHWLNFWELGMSRDLNTCFVHFINVGRLYSLLNEKDMEPMQPLVDIWIKQGVLPTMKPLEGAVPAEGSASATPKSAGGDGATAAPGIAT